MSISYVDAWVKVSKLEVSKCHQEYCHLNTRHLIEDLILFSFLQLSIMTEVKTVKAQGDILLYTWLTGSNYYYQRLYAND